LKGEGGKGGEKEKREKVPLKLENGKKKS